MCERLSTCINSETKTKSLQKSVAVGALGTPHFDRRLSKRDITDMLVRLYIYAADRQREEYGSSTFSVREWVGVDAIIQSVFIANRYTNLTRWILTMALAFDWHALYGEDNQLPDDVRRGFCAF